MDSQDIVDLLQTMMDELRYARDYLEAAESNTLRLAGKLSEVAEEQTALRGEVRELSDSLTKIIIGNQKDNLRKQMK